MVQYNIQNHREVLVLVVDFLIKWWGIISMQTAILSWERQCLQYSRASGKFLWSTASLLFFLLPILADHTRPCSFVLNNDKKVEQNWVAGCGFCFQMNKDTSYPRWEKAAAVRKTKIAKRRLITCGNGADVRCVLSTSDGAEHHPTVGEVCALCRAGPHKFWFQLP